MVAIHVSYKGQSHRYDLSKADASVDALRRTIAENLRLNPGLQKLIIKGRLLTDDAQLLTDGTKVLLFGSSESAVDGLRTEEARQAAVAKRRAAGASLVPKARPVSSRPSQDDMKYTFLRISPLPHLPQADRSDTFLKKLAADPSIRKVMRRHKYVVGHLTELDPRLYTSHDGKILGLNKNGGQEILLRLRTDSLDGWRDYKTVRKTLIHELCHNEHGEHDSNFWALFRLLSGEVEVAEGGHTVAQQGDLERYIPQDSAFAPGNVEASSWSGGTRRLGGNVSSQSDSDVSDARERATRAAEARRSEQQQQH
ncbi:hypothetical protein PYCC9005_004088 [Savitreella phatthalungensis]